MKEMGDTKDKGLHSYYEGAGSYNYNSVGGYGGYSGYVGQTGGYQPPIAYPYPPPSGYPPPQAVCLSHHHHSGHGGGLGGALLATVASYIMPQYCHGHVHAQYGGHHGGCCYGRYHRRKYKHGGFRKWK